MSPAKHCFLNVCEILVPSVVQLTSLPETSSGDIFCHTSTDPPHIVNLIGSHQENIVIPFHVRWLTESWIIIWEEKQEENEEKHLTLSVYGVFLVDFIELTGKQTKKPKQPSFLRFLKLNLEHTVGNRESSFFCLDDHCHDRTRIKIFHYHIYILSNP